MRNLGLALALAAAVAGCSKSKSSGPSGGGCTVTGSAATTVSCTWTGDHMCDQVSGTMTNCEVASLSSSCTGGGGAYAAAACNTTGTVAGYCYYSSAQVITGVPIAAGASMREYFYTAGWTLSTAQSYCGSPPAGVWTN